MSVAFYDEDMMKYVHVPFNLEIMKMAAYYKKKKEILMFDTKLNIDKYSNYILRKDYYDGTFPSIIAEHQEKIKYGGLAFTNNQYEPMDLVIEKQKPDTSIYAKMKSAFGKTPKLTTIFNQMSAAEHLRLSLDGKTVWKDFEKQFSPTNKTRTIFFHDYDIANIEGSKEIIDYCLNLNKSNYSRAVGLKFPIILFDEQELLKWIDLYPKTLFYSLEFRGKISNEGIVEFCNKQVKSAHKKVLEYYITSNYNNEEDFIKDLPYFYRQIAYIRRFKIKISIKYDTDFFSDKRWERVIVLMNAYLRSAEGIDNKIFNEVIKRDSMYNFCKNHLLIIKKRVNDNLIGQDEARELFYFVRDNHPDLFGCFYECRLVDYKGGEFVDAW